MPWSAPTSETPPTTARPSTLQPKVDTRYKPAPGTGRPQDPAPSRGRGLTPDPRPPRPHPNTLRGRLARLAAGGWLANERRTVEVIS